MSDVRKILVVEDEDAIRDFVVINLERAGYLVTSAADGEEALRTFERAGGDFDAVLLDIMMPGIDGFAVCRRIREIDSTIGIIMLSAKTQEMDKVNGLMLGADDYMTKPFSPSELLARIDAVCRRVAMLAATGPVREREITSGPFLMDTRSRTVRKNGVLLEMTQVEFQLMEFFFKNRNTALERGRILNTIWGENYVGDEKIVDVNVRRLRMKIEDNPSTPVYIQTIWGFGYKWND
ncbi:MAG: response regulator transcription factor [Ruminococcaceae bacterium]|nr:response regulator transcription factor [Oscillospiraceae bacterium]